MSKDNTNSNYTQVDKERAYMLEWATANTRELMLLGLALTSMGVVYMAAKDKAHDYFGIYLSSVIATAVTIFIYLAVDWLLGILLPLVEHMWFGEKTDESAGTGLLRALLTFLVITLLSVSGGMTFLTGKIFALTVNEAPTTTDIEQQVASENETYNLQLSEINKELEEARRTEKSRIRAAEREKKSLIAAAINSKGAKMAKLYHEGNSWAAKQLRSNIDKATTAGDLKIASERMLVSDLRNKKATLLTDGSESKNLTLQGLINIKQAKMDAYTEVVETYKNYVIYLDLFLVFGVFILTIVIGVSRKKFGKQYDVETGYAVMYILDRIKDLALSLVQLVQWAFGMTVLLFQAGGNKVNDLIVAQTGLDVGTINAQRPRMRAPHELPTQTRHRHSPTDTKALTPTDTKTASGKTREIDTPDTKRTDTTDTPRATRDTADTAPNDTGDTGMTRHEPKPTRTTETQTVTIIQKLEKDPDAIVKMIKRMRRRWARSFADHPEAPNNANTRKNLRDLAQEEWEILEDIGYQITESKEDKFKLDVKPPSNR